MRCNCTYCRHNDGDGYCLDDSYVSISSEGECDLFEREPEIDLGLKCKEENNNE